MKSIEEFEKQLVDNKLMKTYEETALYENAVGELFRENNPECINSLIKGFADATENHEVMYSNLHGIEYFSKTIGLEKYINIILPLLKSLQSDAYEWSETFYLRLLNNDKSFGILLKTLQDVQEPDRKILKIITQKLIDRNPSRFKEKGEKILSII